MRNRADILAVACGVAVAVWLVQLRTWLGQGLGDLPTYEHTYRLIDLGLMPYRDFRLEYPPLAAAVFWLAGWLPGSYGLAFSMLMLLGLVAAMVGTWKTACALGATRGVTATAVGLVALAPALMGTLTQTRYDVLIAALVAWLAYAAATDRWTLVWTLMGVAIVAKLVPLLAGPCLLAIQLRRHPPARALRTMVPGAAVVVAVLAPFLWLSPSGLWQVLAYHLDRPLQIESLGAALLLTARLVVDVPVYHVTSFGSDNLEGGPAALVASVSGLVSLAVLVAVLVTVVRAGRLPQPHRGYLAVSAIAATLAGTTATGKVLSPQYLLWLVPLVVLAAPRWVAAAAAMVAALALSQVVFPSAYRALTEDFSAGPVLVLAARDALLVVITWLVWPRVRTVVPAAPPPAQR